MTEPVGAANVSPPRILIVDDDPQLLVLLADELRADGYDIQTARNGDEALRRPRPASSTHTGRTHTPSTYRSAHRANPLPGILRPAT